MIGELTASILHQVNGPLMYLLLNLDRAAQAVTSPEASEALREARDGAEIIRDLSRDVMQLARRAAGGVDVVNIRSIVESALRLTSARVHAVAAIETAFEASPRVRGDATLLLQVLVNGLQNAAEACEATETRSHTVRVSIAMDGLAKAVISIADDGGGASPEHARRVFEAFFTTKEVGKGTGLGLSLAKRVVELAGGQIGFESTEGVGSVLRITLPAMGEDE
jgi:signal transduction histidine kinase